MIKRLQLNNFRTAQLSMLSILAIGPILVAGCVVTGGNPLDGFAGSSHNANWQDKLLDIGFWVTVIGGIIAFALSLVLSILYTKKDKLFLLLPFMAILIPISSFIAYALLGAVTSIFFRLLWKVILSPFN